MENKSSPGSVQFKNAVTLKVPFYPAVVGIADFNSDGKPDVGAGESGCFRIAAVRDARIFYSNIQLGKKISLVKSLYSQKLYYYMAFVALHSFWCSNKVLVGIESGYSFSKTKR